MVQSAARIVDGDMRRPSNLLKTLAVPVKTLAVPEAASAEPGPPTNYLDLYGLSKHPFGGSAESAGYILFGSHRRAFEMLVDHMVNGSGLVVLSGEEGSGKTETLRAAAAVAGESGIHTIIISRPGNGRITLDRLLAALEGPPELFHQSGRKALLADDIELMPNDCIALLLSLVRSKPETGGCAIVLSRSAAETTRPDVGELAGLAANTIRLSRLGPAEVRQYIERSLWVAGGTTRRLLTPDAMKLLTVRSGGLPGSINRMMEAVFTAGFARGDTMITAKTVSAVMGPPAPRSRPRPDPTVRTRDPTGVASHAVQITAGCLFVIGASVFLYKGLTGETGHPVPARQKAAVAQAPPPPQVLPTPTPAPLARRVEPLPPDLMAALMKRGNQSLDLGDIAAARLLFQRAAEAGNGAAATALGRTYDPAFTAAASARDPGRAAEWYQKAIALGDPNAADLLKRLPAPYN
jgi:type II secretory pathway predicted ATPase ExeA